jgi:hypothetical protein
MAKAKVDPVTGKKLPTGDYPVGYARTPVHSRFKPGQCGHLAGRGKGKRNMRTELKEIAEKQVEIIDNGKKRKISLVGANLLAHGTKGARGDVRSGTLFLNQSRVLGVLDPDDSERADLLAQEGMRSTDAATPSSMLFQNLDHKLLSRADMNELSRLAEIIDLGGDITALGVTDFERVKTLVNKGRGKNITPP